MELLDLHLIFQISGLCVRVFFFFAQIKQICIINKIIYEGNLKAEKRTPSPSQEEKEKENARGRRKLFALTPVAPNFKSFFYYFRVGLIPVMRQF